MLTIGPLYNLFEFSRFNGLQDIGDYGFQSPDNMVATLPNRWFSSENLLLLWVVPLRHLYLDSIGSHVDPLLGLIAVCMKEKEQVFTS